MEKEWEFIFMGANIDAVETAKAYGIDESRAANFSTKRMNKAYESSSKVMDILLEPTMSISVANEKMNKCNWKDDLDED